jgi:hypothetical protein
VVRANRIDRVGQGIRALSERWPCTSQMWHHGRSECPHHDLPLDNIGTAKGLARGISLFCYFIVDRIIAILLY